jgi:hypothetical protein
MELMISSYADFSCVNVVVELHILSLNEISKAAYNVLDWWNRHKAERFLTLKFCARWRNTTGQWLTVK